MKYIIYTLGCKVNQYETQAIEALLVSRGHKPCVEGEIADAVIVNTCAVTAEAGRKSRQAIHRLREENPGAVAAVLGCYSQLSPDAVQKLGADIVYGTADRLKLIDAVEKAVATGEGEKALDKPFERRVFEELPAGAVSGHTRALLKIQDGCVNFCSYCIIPYTRGRVRSLPMEAAVRQAAELDKKGYRELVITGIEIASYGVDLPGKPDLADVVCAIADAAPHMRLRLGSIEPSVITEDFCKKIAALRQRVSAFSSFAAIRLRCNAQGHEPQVRHRAVLRGDAASAPLFSRLRHDLRRYSRFSRRDARSISSKRLLFSKKRSFPTHTFSRTRAAPALRRIRWTARSTARQRQSAQSRRAPSSPKRAAGFLRA